MKDFIKYFSVVYIVIVELVIFKFPIHIITDAKTINSKSMLHVFQFTAFCVTLTRCIGISFLSLQ